MTDDAGAMQEPNAPVVDIEQLRRRRGRQTLTAQGRRANPRRRAPRAIMVPDYEKMGDLERSEIQAIDKGTKAPPLKVRTIRRLGRKIRNPRPPWSRQARRIAWKIERRGSGAKVAWADSRSARCELAPVIPISHRGTAGRFRVPLVSVRTDKDRLDGAA